MKLEGNNSITLCEKDFFAVVEKGVGGFFLGAVEVKNVKEEKDGHSRLYTIEFSPAPVTD